MLLVHCCYSSSAHALAVSNGRRCWALVARWWRLQRPPGCAAAGLGASYLLPLLLPSSEQVLQRKNWAHRGCSSLQKPLSPSALASHTSSPLRTCSAVRPAAPRASTTATPTRLAARWLCALPTCRQQTCGHAEARHTGGCGLPPAHTFRTTTRDSPRPGTTTRTPCRQRPGRLASALQWLPAPGPAAAAAGRRPGRAAAATAGDAASSSGTSVLRPRPLHQAGAQHAPRA